MYSKVLVALDGSKLSEAILPHARTLAEKLAVPVELLEVIDYDTLMPDNVDPKQDAMVAQRKTKILEYLNNLAATFHGKSRMDCAVEVGHPEEVIVDHAAAAPDTLVAMTTHGRSGIQRWVLGSVAEKFLLACRTPLLLFRTVAPSVRGDCRSCRRRAGHARCDDHARPFGNSALGTGQRGGKISARVSHPVASVPHCRAIRKR